MADILTLDFETYYSKEYSLSKMTTEAYIRSKEFEVIGVGVRRNDGPLHWMSGDYKKTAEYLHSLDIPNTNLVCHNTAFDGAILAWKFGIRPMYYFDTLSLARPITGESIGGSLARLAKHFMLGEKGTEVVQAMGKRRADFTSAELAQYGEYCKNDVLLTYLLFNILREHSTPKEMYIIDLMLRMYTDPVITLDKPRLSTHLSRIVEKKESLLKKLGMENRDSLMSNPQFAELLRKLNVEPPMKVSPTTGKETFAFSKTDLGFKALLEHPDIRVQTLVASRLGVKSTLEETRTTSFIEVSKRGELPILLNYYGAHTGRASGGDKMNLQNLPRGGELRASMRAKLGHKLVACDSAQIEARVVAWLAGEKELLEDFQKGVDIYSKFASIVYGEKIDRKKKVIDANGKETTPHFVQGFVGKTCILGLGYGMGPAKFRDTLKIGQAGVSVDMPIEQAEQTVALYRATYPKIAMLWKSAQQALEAIVSGHTATFGVGVQLHCTYEGIKLPNGMMLRYRNLRREEGVYVYDGRYGPIKLYGGKIVENVVQALARIVVFDQMAKIDQQLRKVDSEKLRFKVVLTVHDEVVVMVPEDYAESTLKVMLDIMSQTPKWAQGLPISCEGAVGDSYGDCK